MGLISLNAQFIAEAFIAILAIVDPIAVIPFFTTLTEGYGSQEKKNVIVKCTPVAVATLMIFGLVGQYIFLIFQITILAFQIVGGTLLFKFAI